VAFKDYQEGARTDLEGLRHFDTDDDGFLTASDEEWDLFHAWQDSDGDGVASEGEMLSLSELGTESISLTSDGVEYLTAGGDVTVHGTAAVEWTDGTRGEAADASFRYADKAQPESAAPESEIEHAPIEIVTHSGEVINLDEPNPASEQVTPPAPAEVSCELEAPIPAPQPALEEEAAAAAAAMAA